MLIEENVLNLIPVNLISPCSAVLSGIILGEVALRTTVHILDSALIKASGMESVRFERRKK